VYLADTRPLSGKRTDADDAIDWVIIGVSHVLDVAAAYEMALPDGINAAWHAHVLGKARSHLAAAHAAAGGGEGGGGGDIHRLAQATALVDAFGEQTKTRLQRDGMCGHAPLTRPQDALLPARATTRVLEDTPSCSCRRWRLARGQWRTCRRLAVQ